MPKSQEGQGLLFLARQAFRSALSKGGWARGWRVMSFPREEAWPSGGGPSNARACNEGADGKHNRT